MYNCTPDRYGLLYFPDGDPILIKRMAQHYYIQNLAKADIRAPDGKPVTGFSMSKFHHIISSSSNPHDGTGLHDIELDMPRARAISLIPRVIRGEVKVTSYSRYNCKMNRRETVLVTSHPKLGPYLVVLEEGNHEYRILTAFVATVQYLRSCWIKGGRVSVSPWRAAALA